MVFDIDGRLAYCRRLDKAHLVHDGWVDGSEIIQLLMAKLFNIRRKGSFSDVRMCVGRGYNMTRVIVDSSEGDRCGACHMHIAFVRV